jgi:acetolactate synthase-1/2/3 large subunit
VILALGCRFSEFATKRWTIVPRDAKLIHVDIDPEELGRIYVPSLAISADARATVQALATASEAAIDERVRVVRATRARGLRERLAAETQIPEETATTGVGSASLVLELGAALDRHQAILVHDMHSFGPWILRYMPLPRPGSFYGAAGGAMGWGLPAAMGVKLARPDEPVIAILGDGSFWMVAQDLETAVRETIPVVCVIANNFSYGNTRDRQSVSYGGRHHGVFYENPDFAEFARMLGAHGERVEHAVELGPAIDRAIASDLPAIVDVIQSRWEGLPPGLQPPTAR